MPKKQKSQKDKETKPKSKKAAPPDKEDGREEERPSMVTQVVEVVEITEESQPVLAESVAEESSVTAQASPSADTEEPAETPVEEESIVEPETPADKETPEAEAEKPAKSARRETEVVAEPEAELPNEETASEETTYEEVAEEESPDTSPKSSKSEESSEVGRQQVVEELFSKRDADSLTEISVSGKRKRSPIFLWAFVVIVAAVTTGVGLILFSGKQPANLAVFPAKPSPTPTPEPTVAPTPVPELKRENITVQVLNGGGVAGAASTMKTFLTDKGYQVTDVGNTDEYTYTDTEILVKPAMTQALTLLKDDLKSEYTLGTASATLPEDVSYDARVIVGSE